MISTIGDLVTFCLRTAGINGVGQTPMAEDANTGLQLASNILAEWQRRRWLVWSLTDTSKVSTGADSYTIGTGGDFNIPRPDRISSAYVRLINTAPNALDIPLGIIGTREEYNAIVLKSLSTFPAAVFYESAFPMGVLHFWPVPAASLYEMHIATKATLPTYTALTDPIALPPEYMSALTYSLAVELALNYGRDPSPGIVAKMREALNVVRMANVQVPELGMPAALRARRGGGMAAGSSPSFQTGGAL